MNEDAVANTLAAGDALRDAGAQVDEAELSWSRAEIAAAAKEHLKSLFVPDWLRICESSVDHLMGMEQEGRLIENQETSSPATMCFCAPMIPAEQQSLMDLPLVNGTLPEDIFHITPTVVFKMFSRCPVMSPRGLPRMACRLEYRSRRLRSMNGRYLARRWPFNRCGHGAPLLREEPV